MLTHKHTYYFETREQAYDYAKKCGYPRDRIIAYELGYAIQLWVSGPYVGPHTVVHEWNEQSQA